MIDHDQTFDAAYGIREVAGEPGSPDVEFSSEGVSHGHAAFELAVEPEDGSGWRGAFLGGTDALNQLVNGPSPDLLVAVAGGVGYVVPVLAPEGYFALPLRPITRVLPAPAAHVVICAGLTAVAAIGPDGGTAWISPRLVADGFYEVRIAGSALVVRGRALTSVHDVEITLDLTSGSVIAEG